MEQEKTITKAKIQRFTDLKAWQEGHKLVILVYKLTKKFPREEMYSLIDQMRRAASSITSNIAEGFGRQGYKEKANFYRIAAGSLTELENQVLISKDVGYLNQADFDTTMFQADLAHKLLAGLISKTKSFIHSNLHSQFSILSFFILFSIFYFLFSVSSASAATWFNDYWQYRKSIPITNSAADQAKVYIQATINTSDTTRFNAGCSDLRFTDASGKVLPYYIVSGCRTASTVVNTYFQNLITGLSTVYYYYGNPSAPKAASLTNFPTVASSYSVGSIGAEEQGTAPVAYWSFDEGQGTTVSDGTSNKNTGVLTNMSATASSTSGWQTEDVCVSGKCLAFDGSNDYVDTGMSANLNFSGKSQISISQWVKPSFAETSGLSAMVQVSRDSAFTRIQSSKAKLYLNIGGVYSNVLNSNQNLVNNKWYHIVTVYDGDASSGTQVKMYINGVLDNQGTATGVLSDGGAFLGNIGYRPGGNYFNGTVDEVKIYSYARTAAQIKLDYNAGLAGMSGRAAGKGSSVSVGQRSASWLSNGLVGYWKMDEAVGTWNGTAGEVKDWSGNGNNGTAAGTTGGTASTTAGKFGNGGSFDGVDDSVDLGTSVKSYISKNSTFTISTWFNTKSSSSAQDGPTILMSSMSSSDRTAIQIYNGYLVVATYNGTAYAKKSVAFSSLNQWNHIVMINSGGVVSGYLNGILMTSSAISPSTATPNKTYIGTDGYGFFSGSIDDVRIYNRALSDREVRDLYNYAPGPIGWWPMDEGSGQVVNDKSGNSNNGTLGAAATASTDDPVWTTGKNGKGLKFDGVNDVVNISNSAINGANSLTVCAWVYPKSYGGGGKGRIIDTNGGAFFLIYNVGTNFMFSLDSRYSNYASSASGSAVFNKWVYLCVTSDSNYKGNIYINGVLSGAPDQNLVGANTTATLRIGNAYDGSRTWDGSIDDVRIYNYVRTPEQIMEDMNARGNTNEGGSGSAAVSAAGKTTVGYWKFDEGQGTTAYDSSGNKNNGTLTNMATAPSTAVSGWTGNGKMGKALVFDGGDDFVSVANSIDSTGQKAVSLWMKTDSAAKLSSGEILVYVDSSTTDYLVVGVYQGKILASAQNAAANSRVSSTILLPNTWYHVVVVKTTSDISNVYINGVDVTSSSNTVWSGTNVGYKFGCSWRLGSCEVNWSGSLDEVKIYNYALTPDDIRTEYNAGSALKLGSFSTDVNGVASSSAASIYCVPGSTDPCSPPVAEWKFEDGKNSVTAADTSGNGNTGTIYPGTAGANRATSTMWTTGKNGKGLKFDGVDDYVNAGTMGTWGSSRNQGFTVSAWVKQNNNSSIQAIIGTDDNSSTGRNGLSVKLNTDSNNTLLAGSIRVGLASDEATPKTLTGATNANNIPVGQWTYILVTFNPSNNTITIYVNGVSKAVTYGSQQTPAIFGNFAANALTVGVYNATGLLTRYFNGSMDDVRIFNYARTPAQVAWDYNRGKPVAQWKFDEGQGGVAHDSSGNNNNGTIYPGTAGTQTATSTMWSAGASGKRNGSLNFDGTDDRVDFGALASLKPLSSDYSVSIWAKGTGTVGSYTGIFDYGNESDNTDFISIAKTVNNLAFIVNDGNYSWSTYNASFGPNSLYGDGNWHHYVGTINKANAKIYTYLDGKLVTSKTIPASFDISPSQNMKVGLAYDVSGNYWFTGQIDDVQIFNYALTAVQVKTIYNEGAAGFR